MNTIAKPSNDFHFPRSGGEMGELIRSTNWDDTSLGHPNTWPQSLRTIVSVVMENPFGMYIVWGSDYIQLYNDGYRPILGSTKHPQALGITACITFEEIWHIIGPMFAETMTGKTFRFPDFKFSLNRNGFLEDCYFDFSYAPIRKEDGEVGGILVTVLETTNKKKADDALKKSEAHFRAMADNIPNLAWMADASGWIFWYNKQWYDYTGATAEQMEGWGWQSVHHPEKLDHVVEKWKASISSGEPFEMTFPLKGADGKFRQFLTRVLPVNDDESKICQWFGTCTDVTEQIAAEQSAKESEQRFRRMAEATAVLISVGDETSEATYFNKAWTELTGRAMETLLKFGWADLLHPEDLPYFMDFYLEAVKHKRAFTYEFRILDKHGAYRWLFASGALRSSAGDRFSGYISSCVDITDRKKAEKALLENERNLRNTILQAPVAMCILKGEDYKVELANTRMFEFWGKTSEEVMNKPVFEGVPEGKDQGFELIFKTVYDTGKSYEAEDVPATISRFGKLMEVFVNLVLEAFREPDGTVSGILVVVIDVTAQVVARKKIEEVVAERTKELADANKDLKKSNAELAQFAYIASHDLQEPLRKISTFSDMLENRMGDQMDDLSRNYLHKINLSSLRMNTLIRDVLAYSELIKEHEVFSTVDLKQVFEEVKIDFELLIEQKKILIECSELPVIEAIPLQMAQLFGNIISNSFKYTKSGREPHLTISCEKMPFSDINKNTLLLRDTEYYKIVFADNGIGFKQEYAEQIFNIFQRLHGKSEYEGTGIGLAMCKKIALNHHGDMNAYGSSDEGAVFNIFLPVKQSV